jgi:glyoxylase-like metal-dependent hydrolase (beta-lactamase superfamily II)
MNAVNASSQPGSEPESIDVEHLGRARVIGAWLVRDVIVDPGPTSCMDTLLEGLGSRPVRAIALTHIHLDHAGATGSLARLFPDAEVWVHERGAPHLVDPSRLLASARRLYGERMDTLWGKVLAVPAQRIRALVGGERLEGFDVAYTPGHAFHLVAYLDDASGDAFTGDVAGVRIGEGPVLAPTPPPDIDLPAWRRSISQLREWAPRRLALTHFGAFADVEAHLSELEERLAWLEALATGEQEEAFASAVRDLVAGTTAPATAAAYAQAMPPGQSYQGLRRHLEGR